MAQTTPNHTQTVSGWAAHDPSGKITPFVFKRRENGINDVTIKVLYCGICHTDLHFAKNDWGMTMYPVVPGHEITGLITKVGSNVKEFKEGDRVGVGCLAATCLECEFCKSSQENYCDQLQFTYNGIFWDGSITYGGYSKMLVADHRYVVHIPENLPLDATAPLLCAGVTVFTPMKDHKLHKTTGKKIGVVGLGGLGHVAVKFGKAFGHHVTVISTSPAKEKEAKEHLGADDFLVSTDPQQLQKGKRTLDFILNTVSAKHSLGSILELLKVNGTMVVVGAPDQPFELPSFPLIFGKRAVKGSVIGGISETREMMNLCGKHNITCDIELTTPDKINEALDRVAKNDVRENGINDVTIKILYCGICHTDLHFAKNDWGMTMYPVVPGHEITGLITKAGSNVKEFKEGDRVGVGCLAATCLECEFCKSSQENYCDQLQFTYNGIFWDGSITYGGYSKMLVADHRYVVHIPQNLPLDAAAPLLCAGATVFTPMKDHNLHKPTGKKIGVVGLGGLGHVAVKFGKAFGHHVTVISTSPAKEHLGADDFLVSTDPQQLQVLFQFVLFFSILLLEKINSGLIKVNDDDDDDDCRKGRGHSTSVHRINHLNCLHFLLYLGREHDRRNN
ncbi:hypothetical protein DVH24_013030 [Malus domestica]|uniref:Enoyl reductase (ER) domain-containing protein n=1 Tax=Malus domestica TaxID=3750 RepID=A0A498HPG0_MALDO|nr:hypothetical protein DVH24_013030 [Malus domestica]